MAAFIFFQTVILIPFLLFHRMLECERDPQRSSSFNPFDVDRDIFGWSPTEGSGQ